MVKSPIYERILEPIKIRKEVLKTAIEATQLLQKYENYKGIKYEKMQKLRKLYNLNTSVNRLIGHLRTVLPKVEEEKKKRIIVAPPKKKIREVKKVKEVKKEKPKIKTASDKLERELKDIQDKLKSL